VPNYRARVARISAVEKAAWAESIRAGRLPCGSPTIDPSLARLRELCHASTSAPGGSRPAGLSRCLSGITMLAEEKGRPGLAEDLDCEAVHVLDGVEAPPQFRQDDALRTLANIYRLHGRFTEEQTALERALAIGDRERTPYRLGERSNLDVLARFHLAHGQFAQAAPLLEREIAVLDEVGLAKMEESAVAFAELARAYRALGRPADAEPLLERSIDFYRRHSTGKLSTADSVLPLVSHQQELAQVYVDEWRLAAAEPLLRQAVAEWDAAAARHPEWRDLDRERAEALDTYAALLERTGRAREALPLRLRAESLHRNAPPETRWQPGCPSAETGPPHTCPLP
jgi:tetratricopeptide (TPR) repeat protein